MNREDFSVATFNLFNLQEPGKPMNEGQTPWTPEQFELKTQWTVWQLTTLNPDIVGLQELWSKKALDAVLDYNYGTKEEPKRSRMSTTRSRRRPPVRRSSAGRWCASRFLPANRSGWTNFPRRCGWS